MASKAHVHQCWPPTITHKITRIYLQNFKTIKNSKKKFITQFQLQKIYINVSPAIVTRLSLWSATESGTRPLRAMMTSLPV